MSDNGFYHGSGLNISNAPMGQMQAHGVEAFAQKDMLQASANRANAVSGVLSDIEKLKDYKAGAEADIGMGAADAEVQNDVRKGFESAPGTPNSFYFEDGQLDESKINEVIERAKERLQAIQPKFFDAGRAAKWEADRDRYLASMAVRIKGQADSYQLRAIRGVSEATMQGHLTAGRWDEALSEVDKQLNAGILSPAQASLKRQEIDKASAGEEIAYLLEQDPYMVSDALQEGKYNSVLTPAERANTRRAVRARLDELDRDGFLGRNALELDFEGDSPAARERKKAAAHPEYTGAFTEQEIIWGEQLKTNGMTDDLRKQILAQAVKDAQAFDPDGNIELQQDEFVRRYGALGIEKTKAEAIWDAAVKSWNAGDVPSIDVDRHLKASIEPIYNNAEWESINGRISNEESVEEGGEFYNMYAALGKFDDMGLEERQQWMRERAQKQLIEKTKGDISAAFQAWRSTEGGKKASPGEQMAKLSQITKQKTGRNTVFLGDERDAESASQRWIQSQRRKHTAWEQSRVLAMPTEQNPVARPISVNVTYAKEGDTMGEDDIRLPKEMMQGLEPGKAQVVLTFDNKRYRAFNVVGEASGNMPEMARAAARRGYAPERVYHCNMRVMKQGSPDFVRMQNRAGGASGSRLKQDAVPAPMRQLLPAFQAAAAQNGLDPRLLLAISMHETGNGTSNAFRNKNNAMGVSNASGPIRFGSPEESIYYMARQLKKNYIDKGLIDIEQIGAKYAPVGAENDPYGLNRHWVNGVKSNLDKLKSE